MKRELAALEVKSPVIGRTTRSSKRLSVGGSGTVSESLVYKRVKRSTVRVQKPELLSNGGGSSVVEVSEASGAVGEQSGAHDVRPVVETGVPEVEEREIGVPEVGERENGVAEVEEREIGVAAGVCSEVVKSVCDVGVGNVDEFSLIAVEEEDVNGGSLVGVVEVDYQDAVYDDAQANGGSIELDNGKVVEGVSIKSPLKANGNSKKLKSSLYIYPKRFTRSALKSKVDTLTLGNDSGEKNKENSGNGEKNKENSGNGELRKEIVVFSEPPMTECNKVKNSFVEKYTRRVTRSASKPKVDDNNLHLVEPVTLGREKPVLVTVDSKKAIPVTLDIEKAVPVTINEIAECEVDKDIAEPNSPTRRKKLEIKMSKQISNAKVPSNVQELLATGLLEGCPVYYDGGKGLKLNGRIRGIGILCSCGLCRGCKVIPPSLFEIHACNKYKRAVQYIFLQNGRSLIHILKACKSTRLNTLEATVQNAIGPLPEKKIIVCQNCKEPFSSMDAESSEPVCSKCVMLNLSPIGPVYSTRKRCRSSNFGFPSEAASACDMVQDSSPKSSVKRSGKEFHTPKSRTSQADCPDVLQDRSQSKSVARSAGVFLTPKLRSSSRIGRISETKISEELKNSPEASTVPKTCSSPVMEKSSGAKHLKKLNRRSSKPALSPKPSKSTLVGKSSSGNTRAKVSSRLREELVTPKASKTSSALISSEKKTSGKITRKDLRLHKLVFEDDVLPDGTELGYYARGQKLLDGFKQGFGIYCNCCNSVVSASQFEAHAGCASRRKPYCYIYTSNGVSLHELSVTLIKDRQHSAKYNDDLCSICADGGNLLLCDGCPRAFHTECASLPSIPRGKWYCKYCQNMFEREKFVAHNANALAAGRVTGVDSIEQITTRSIRIVNNLASEVSACILCRGFDFCKSGFGPRTIILCDQCEKEYHVGCLKDHNMADLAELPDGNWFCSMDCGRIESSLQNLLVRGVEKLPDSLLDIIMKKNMLIGSDSGTDLEVSWRLLSGKIASPETRPLLSQAVAIFHESFAPIIDVVSGHDLIPAMVYGRNVGGQEYGGMYCAVLTANKVVVSAGIFRIFGPEVAELPLVATSSGNHGKGYFQTLFACIERLLAFLKVKTLVLPAAEEAGTIWTARFGFTKMTVDEISDMKRNLWSLVRFQGTSMLHKPVPECRDFESTAE
ncbi:hypothetical protein SOVF_164770 [Spinacia oleracea]|uniref:PHD-type domain-containing protein n=1 Tax=Spinacia oleracea TaxID=3562 RepID=A0A9R0JVT6_SPIOL|nr:uncharacterized protein LOC110788572 [Spinacia oleracea]KNA08208.1 hypothetical protein SOVF_164770 [Spinacia oleracea]